jgi:GTP-binding protein Era
MSDEFLISQDLPEGHRSGFVALVGRPNVGKSTLMNAYLGQKIGIVSEKPQTTRGRLLGILTEPDYQIVFVDTPGIHRPLHRLGAHMVSVARHAIADADVVLWLVDSSATPTDDDISIAEMLRAPRRIPVILALNKIDLVPPDAEVASTGRYLSLLEPVSHVLLSATRGDNRDALLSALVEALPLGPRYFPEEQVTDQDERFLAGELIREQVLQQCRQEVPHAVAVIIEEFKDRSEEMSYISATIAVERDSQKQIVIGRGGKMLKQIGQGARIEIEKALGRRVYLELWVKVIPRWRRDPEHLRRMGYSLPGDGAS